MRLSSWVKIYCQNDIQAIYHRLNMSLIFMPEGSIDQLLNMDEKQLVEYVGKDIADYLIDEKILVPGYYNENDELIGLRDMLVENIRLKMLYLILTDTCNYKCKYCFEETPDYIPSKSKHMSNSTMIKAIDTFTVLLDKYGRTSDKHIIQFYGGEPLLNKSVVINGMKYARELRAKGSLGKKCEITIVTNGLLIDEELTDVFLETSANIGLSIDGPALINNIYRIPKTIAASEAYDKIINNYFMLKNKGVKIGLSITLTPECLEQIDNVADFVINYLGIIEGIGFNILYHTPNIPVNDSYFEKAAEKLLTVFETLRKAGIYEERIMRKVISFSKKRQMYSDCGINGGQIVISPEGKYGVCQDFIKPMSFFEGSIYDEDYDPYKNGLHSNWRRRSPFFIEECQQCEAIAICGGGCPAGLYVQNKDIMKPDLRICAHSKETLKWMIWDTYKKMQ